MSKATIERINFSLGVDGFGTVWYSFNALGRQRTYEAVYSNKFVDRGDTKGLTPVRLSFRKSLKIGSVVTVAKSSYILAQEDNGAKELMAVKVSRNVWRALVPRAYFETGDEGRKFNVTRGEASRFIEGVQSALRVLNAHHGIVPAKATDINRSTSTHSAASGGFRHGRPLVSIRPFSVSVATWIQKGFSDYKTVDHIWAGSKWRRATDPFLIGQAVAMHEAAHVLQYNCSGLSNRDRGHSLFFRQLLREIIREHGAEIAATSSRKTAL